MEENGTCGMIRRLRPEVPYTVCDAMGQGGLFTGALDRLQRSLLHANHPPNREGPPAVPRPTPSTNVEKWVGEAGGQNPLMATTRHQCHPGGQAYMGAWGMVGVALTEQQVVDQVHVIRVPVAKFGPDDPPLDIFDHHRAANFRVFLVI
jgi:hypothetical protein